MSVEPDCSLARVVRITGTRPIEKATSIQVYEVPGWQLVDKIGAYSVGDLAIYCMINTIFPDDFTLTSFLKGERLKTKKLMGEISQGLLLPVSVVPHPVQEGDDLTGELKLRKWIPSGEIELYQEGPTKFPSFCPKTDENRVQNLTEILPRLGGIPVTITEKRDGTSTTFIWNGKFILAGRNLVHSAPGTSSKHYFEMAEKHDLEKKLTQLNRNLAFQGELTGPKINGNRHGLKENQFHVFNIYSIDESRYLPWDQVVDLCTQLQIPHVRVVFRGTLSPEQLEVKYFLKLAEEQVYENKQPAEGVVVKTDIEPRISFKAISNKYLLKHGL